jgi:hypothetical protein
MLPVPFEEDVFKVPSIYNFAVLNTLVGLPMPFLSCRNANLCLAGGDITSAQSHSTLSRIWRFNGKLWVLLRARHSLEIGLSDHLIDQYFRLTCGNFPMYSSQFCIKTFVCTCTLSCRNVKCLLDAISHFCILPKVIHFIQESEDSTVQLFLWAGGCFLLKDRSDRHRKSCFRFKMSNLSIYGISFV